MYHPYTPPCCLFVLQGVGQFLVINHDQCSGQRRQLQASTNTPDADKWLPWLPMLLSLYVICCQSCAPIMGFCQGKKSQADTHLVPNAIIVPNYSFKTRENTNLPLIFCEYLLCMIGMFFPNFSSLSTHIMAVPVNACRLIRAFLACWHDWPLACHRQCPHSGSIPRSHIPPRGITLYHFMSFLCNFSYLSINLVINQSSDIWCIW